MIRHIALIPDGNRRWAKKRGLPSFLGHRAGVEAFQKILVMALDLKIEYLTFWGASADNVTKRSPEEVSFLFSLFEEYFKKLFDRMELTERQIKVDFLGRWRELFPQNVQDVIRAVIEKTKDHKRQHLTFLLAYSGIEEMEEAIRKIVAEQPIPVIDGQTIKRHLWTKDLPPVDLVIRTGGEPHWSSGFMMWDTADSQFYFTETLWPDFGPEEFQKAIEGVSGVERRFGK